MIIFIFGFFIFSSVSAQLNIPLTPGIPCKDKSCGDGYICSALDDTNPDFWCTDKLNLYSVYFDKERQTQFFPESCPTIPCKNDGLCRIDIDNINSKCICKFPFTDKFCDRNLSIKNQTTTTTDKDDNFFPLEFSLGLPQYYNRARPGVDICKLYKDSNIELCKNGGYCVSVFIGKAHCVCPPTTSGDYCEKLLYLHCPTPLRLCNRDFGTCENGNTCICKSGYTGSRCDEEQKCASDYCLNGGTCAQTTTAPFRTCRCRTGFNGSRCENALPIITEKKRECEYSIVLFNDGGYVARLKVIYSLHGIRQAAVTSNSAALLRKTEEVVIPEDAEDVVVRIEKYAAFNWYLVHEDEGLDVEKECTKCYKTWGVVFKPHWDYVLC